MTVKTSSAGANSEIAKANLLQMASVLGQYGNSAQSMVQALADPKLNPSIRAIINDTLNMQKWMAKRLLRAWDENDAEEILPDVAAAIQLTIPDGGKGTKSSDGGLGAAGLVPGGAPAGGGSLSREGLSNIAQMLEGAGGPTQ